MEQLFTLIGCWIVTLSVCLGLLKRTLRVEKQDGLFGVITAMGKTCVRGSTTVAGSTSL